ncbi:FAD:protein FMN transferase [Bacillaceae bacterium Marseille-Q3522]|nr:FAD:protein FMN transferase [Bacillaceae bacterium Marseille-Q3522]
MKKYLFVIVITFVSLLSVSACNNKTNNGGENTDGNAVLADNPYVQTEFLLDTVCRVKVYDKGKQEALEKAMQRIADLGDQLTIHENGSIMDKVNKHAGIEAVQVPNDVYYLVKEGIKYSEESGGSKDITIGPLTLLWGIGSENARKPSDSEIQDVLPLINYKNVELNDENQSIYLKEKGMALDLGSIAKGFIADEAAEVLRDNGVTSAIIDLGGNIYVIGKSPDGSDWNIGVQDPLESRGVSIGYIPKSDASVVTSGIYERFLEVDGVTYPHIFNPKTGYPYNNDIAGVSIIAEKSIDADALASAAYSKGIKEGVAFIEEFENIDAIFVSKDKRVYTTSGVKDVFKLTSSEYRIGDINDLKGSE